MKKEFLMEMENKVFIMEEIFSWKYKFSYRKKLPIISIKYNDN